MPLIRRLTARTGSDVGNTLVQLDQKPLLSSITSLGIPVAASVDGVRADYLSILSSAALSLIILLWMLFAIRATRLFLTASSRRAESNALVRPQTLPLFTNLAAIAIFVFGVYFIFNAWHINMTSWLASAVAANGPDIDQVRTALMAVTTESDAVCSDPEPRVRFRAFGPSSPDFELLCWIDSLGLGGRVLDALNTAVYKRFNATASKSRMRGWMSTSNRCRNRANEPRVSRPTGASCVWAFLHSAR